MCVLIVFPLPGACRSMGNCSSCAATVKLVKCGIVGVLGPLYSVVKIDTLDSLFIAVVFRGYSGISLFLGAPLNYLWVSKCVTSQFLFNS